MEPAAPPPSATPSAVDGAHRRSSRLGRRVSLLLLFAAIALAALPTVIARTPLRDALINRLIGNDSIRVATDKVSLGYLTPLQIEGLQVDAVDGSGSVRIDELAAGRSWLAMIFSGRDLGEFVFERPRVRAVAESLKLPAPTEEELEDPGPPEANQRLPRFSAVIRGAAFELFHRDLAEPVIDLDQLDLRMRVEPRPAADVLVIEPVTLLERQLLRPELCNQGLQLIAPMLANEVDVQGWLSFRLEQFRLPLGEVTAEARSELTEIEGQVQLDGVEVGLRNPITRRLHELASRIAQGRLPERLKVADATAVKFHVLKDRVHHQGLTFLLPYASTNLRIESAGSVGLDESLDLVLAVKLPGTILGRNRLTRFLVEEPIRVHVGGTVEEPRVSLATDEGWAGRLDSLLRQINAGREGDAADGTLTGAESESESAAESDSAPAPALAPDAKVLGSPTGSTTEAVLDIVGGLLEQAAEREEPLLPQLRERLRQRRQSRRDRD